MPLRIEDYAVIGDTGTAALVGKDGSIDWLCLPRFDSDACFSALLGEPKDGRWLIAPKGRVKQVSRRYREGTLILETDFETRGGAVRLIDLMPPDRAGHPDVVRVVQGLRGRVTMRMELIIRFGYGAVVPWVRNVHGDMHAIAGPDSVWLRTPIETQGKDLTTVAEFSVEEGDEVPFVLTWHPSWEPAPAALDAHHLLLTADLWWQEWTGRCTYDGEWGEAVRRSLITLKGLTYAPTGGIVAAPTTSLPEQIGGPRNWDYRYCWLRDAAFSLWALSIGGYFTEAREWRDWLLRAVAGDPAQLQVLYGPGGERRLTELELPWLRGYEDSRPVRIGNAAEEQFQLDVYGEVMDALHVARITGIPADDAAWSLQRQIVQFVIDHWHEPDEGIWEVRGPRRHFTHSKVMAWVALDRAIRAVEKYGVEGPVDEWAKVRDAIRDEVLTRGFDAKRNTFVQAYDSPELDASLLMLPLVRFLPARDPRIRGTVDAIKRELMEDDFVIRYRSKESIDGLPAGEGAFLACTFWLVDNLAMMGRIAEARRIFERLLSLRNDVGLLSEEYDPRLKRLVGNFPQAFTHVGLVTSAYNLDRAVRKASGAATAELEGIRHPALA